MLHLSCSSAACSGHASATTWNRQSPKGEYQWKAPKKSRKLKCLVLKWRGKLFFRQIGKGADNITSLIGSNHFLNQNVTSSNINVSGAKTGNVPLQAVMRLHHQILLKSRPPNLTGRIRLCSGITRALHVLALMHAFSSRSSHKNAFPHKSTFV